MGRAALTRLLLDTHALVWLATENERLGASARRAVGEAASRAELLVSAISFWEIALLIDRGRLGGEADASLWRQNALASGIAEVPVTGNIGIAAVGLDDLTQDPADRIIVAAAVAEEAALVTADKQLLAWPGKLARIDASR